MQVRCHEPTPRRIARPIGVRNRIGCDETPSGKARSFSRSAHRSCGSARLDERRRLGVESASTWRARRPRRAAVRHRSFLRPAGSIGVADEADPGAALRAGRVGQKPSPRRGERVVPDARPCDNDRSYGRQVRSVSLTGLIPALRFGLVVSVRNRRPYVGPRRPRRAAVRQREFGMLRRSFGVVIPRPRLGTSRGHLGAMPFHCDRGRSHVDRCGQQTATAG